MAIAAIRSVRLRVMVYKQNKITVTDGSIKYLSDGTDSVLFLYTCCIAAFLQNIPFGGETF
jgi:hypothetical protein